MSVMPDKISAMIFDLDGVILNSMQGHAASWQSAFAQADLHLDIELFFRYEGALDAKTLSRIFSGKGKKITPDLFEKVYLLQREIYRNEYAQSVEIYPGAASIVKRLANTRIKLALVTSSRSEVLPGHIWNWLTDRFSVLITGDMVSEHKPHPEPYLAAIRALKIEPNQALVVENAPAGIQSANAAGIKSLALATTLAEDQLKQAGLTFKDHDALSLYLEGLGLFQS